MSDKNSKLSRTDLQNALSKYIEDHDTSITKVSGSIPISSSTLSQWFNNKYPGDVDNIDKLISEFLAREEELGNEQYLEVHFVEIRNSEIVFETAKICRKTKEIAVIYGNAGVGKTKAIKEYCKSNRDVVLIEADPKYTEKILFRELCRVLNLPSTGSVWDMFNSVVNELKDTSRLMIIDEAEQLPIKALDLIRRIWDKTNIGIILLGLPRLYYNMKGYRADYAYIYSRVGFTRQLQPLNLEDVTKIVQSIFPKSNGIANVFYKSCEGNARKLQKLLLRSKDVMQYSNMKEINSLVVEEVSKLLMK